MFEVSYVSIPLLIIVLIAEITISIKDNLELYNSKDTLSNLVIGFIFILTGIVFKLISVSVFQKIFDHKIYTLDNTISTWFLAILGCDFVYYSYHWLGHKCRIMWASHSVHHSSGLFNYSTAVRNQFLHLSYRFLFWSPLCLLGFDPLMVIFIDNCTNIYQFLMHTTLVKKLGPLEWIFNTPSHHRVHHASNRKYLDKNFGGIFILYDKLFGTFCKETEAPEYGITMNKPTGSWYNILFFEYKCMFKDAFQCNSLKGMLHVIFKMPVK